MIKRKIIDNEKAVLGMPVYLLVAIFVSALIISLFVLSINTAINNSKVEEIKSEIEKIISEAENMFEYADEGTLVTVSVDFSESLRFVAFGSMPQNGVSQPTDYTLDETMSNNYYFVANDGKISSYSSNARFSSDDTTQIALFGPGSYDLKLELVKVIDKNGGKTYVTIS